MINIIYDRDGYAWKRCAKSGLSKTKKYTNEFFNNDHKRSLDPYRLDGSYGPLTDNNKNIIHPYYLMENMR